LPLAEVLADYTALIDAARERAAAGATVFCLGLWSDRAVTPAFPDYEEGLRQICRAKGGQWVPLSDLFVDPTNHGPAGTPTAQGPSDVFHPNDAGHRAIADRLVAAIDAARP
jgi:acyl-CoA thioesterase-1